MRTDLLPENNPAEKHPMLMEPTKAMPATITGWVLGQTERGTKYIAISFWITAGPYKGRDYTERFYITEKAKKRLDLFFNTIELGYTVANCSTPALDLMEGKELLIDIEQGEYEGKVYNAMPYRGFSASPDITEKESGVGYDEDCNF